MTITIADFDAIETKNLSYQNYTYDDVGKPKAEVMARKFGLKHLDMRIDRPADLKPFDFVVLCVDNSKARKMVYEVCSQNGVGWLDLRCNERNIAYYLPSAKNTLSEMLTTIGNTDEQASCQREVDIKDNKISYACVAIAAIGVQVLLNVLRNETVADTMIKRV